MFALSSGNYPMKGEAARWFACRLDQLDQLFRLRQQLVKKWEQPHSV